MLEQEMEVHHMDQLQKEIISLMAYEVLDLVVVEESLEIELDLEDQE